MHRKFYLSAFLAISIPWNPAIADWTQFRGNLGQGVADVKEVPLRWNSTENVLWKSALPGHGWSSPVVVAGKVLVTSAVRLDDDGQPRYSLCVVCLDAATGDMLWNTQVFTQNTDAPRIHQKNSHASPTPVVVGDSIYVHFGHQGTACLSLQGKVRWRNSTIQYEPVHGNGGTPIVDDQRLIFSVDGSNTTMVVALDCRTGNEIWRFDRESKALKKFSFSTPALIDVNGRRQLISPGSDVVHALDPITGRLIWQVRYDGYSVIPKPVFDGNFVYICTGFNTPSLLVIRPDGTGDVTESHIQWQTKKNVPKTPSVIAVGGLLFMVADNGIASCLRAETGQQLWRERLGGNFSASPVSAMGRVYFTNEEGETTVVAATDEFKTLATNALHERVLASPAIVEGQLFLRTQKHLYCITP